MSAMTSNQLTAQRAAGRWKKYFLAISNPPTVWSARINQTFSTLDNVVMLTYDTPSGTLANVLPGMTCLVGSTAGAADIGIVRVRKAPNSTKLFIGQTSGMQFADNQYLTVIQELRVWAREPSYTGGETKIDGDLVFDAVNSFAPLVRMGPIALVLEMTGSTIAHTPTASGYFPTGRTAASYLWTAPGASASSGMTTATPTITYNAAGEYLETCQITDSAGAVGKASRIVLVNPSSAAISPPEISGDVDKGTWSVKVEGFSGVDLSSLRDGALAVLWKQDFKNKARDTSYGPYLNAENIRMVGWVDGQSLQINTEFGTASFTVHGPGWWLDQIQGSPMAIKDASSPANWDEFASLTTDKALYRLLWQTTLPQICDITLTGITTAIPTAVVNSGTLLKQINTLASEKLVAALKFDRFGCGFVQVPVSLLPATPRAAVTSLMDIAATDWTKFDPGERVEVEKTAMVEIGGVVWDGGTARQVYSRAPGNTLKKYGSAIAPYSGLAVVSQAELNVLSGNVLAHDNCEYPGIDVDLYWANDFIDIAPVTILRASLASTLNPRGISWTNKHLVPLAIQFNYDNIGGGESTSITFEEETDGTGALGVTYVPPQPPLYVTPPMPPVPPGGVFPPIVPPPGTWMPPGVNPPPTGTCQDVDNYFTITWDKPVIYSTDAVLISKSWFPCKIRGSSFAHSTKLNILIRWSQTEDANLYAAAQAAFHCFAIGTDGSHILAGTVTYMGGDTEPTEISFAPVGDTVVAGFSVEMDPGWAWNGTGEALTIIIPLAVDNPGGTVVETISDLTNGHYQYHFFGNYFNYEYYLNKHIAVNLAFGSAFHSSSLYLAVRGFMTDIDHGDRDIYGVDMPPLLKSDGAYWGITYQYLHNGINRATAFVNTAWMLTDPGYLPYWEKMGLEIGERKECTWDFLIDFWYGLGSISAPAVALNPGQLMNVCAA